MTDHWGDFDFDDHHDVPDVPDDLHHEIDHQAFEAEDHHHFEEEHTPPEIPDIPEIDEPVVTLAEDLFPPTLDIGDLPEPVDGFPWIDTTTLGSPDTTGFTAQEDPVTPDELAAYAHTSGPADWTALADSDDPATAALARWWTPDEQ
ncbi:hypothetical protein FB565_007972 [Actinoplanes lutulentus]|uniref:Uncharacterized protein n=1 Tax=Actinoplanes lutulentus TaxID=1287878 RepID=A0A327Z4S3_9ACTN|nr:hypothetical protein [Actinoplanes lutulentus]MBB2948189.1 hypothetical protein [Actinoplanes lutulentus]RAK31311.1 hypothetical protein B0I29_115117 [Actinoplanes lutulentus]